jgi:hypothetical protein
MHANNMLPVITGPLINIRSIMKTLGINGAHRAVFHVSESDLDHARGSDGPTVIYKNRYTQMPLGTTRGSLSS